MLKHVSIFTFSLGILLIPLLLAKRYRSDFIDLWFSQDQFITEIFEYLSKEAQHAQRIADVSSTLIGLIANNVNYQKNLP